MNPKFAIFIIILCHSKKGNMLSLLIYLKKDVGLLEIFIKKCGLQCHGVNAKPHVPVKRNAGSGELPAERG